MHAIGGGLAHLPGAFVRPLGGGVAVFVRAGSPMNKIIGAGLGAPIDPVALAEVERAYFERGDPARIELSTLAVPETGLQLTARGYRLHGFENLLVRPVAAAPPPLSDVVIERATTAEALAEWKRLSLDGFAAPDESGVVADSLSRAAIDQVLDDTLAAGVLDRYLARREGAPAGAASLYVRGEVALLGGSTTLVAQRRRGVQGALIARRLHDAAARGAQLAIITTAPGTQSQANVMKRGFALAYSRALLVKEPIRE